MKASDWYNSAHGKKIKFLFYYFTFIEYLKSEVLQKLYGLSSPAEVLSQLQVQRHWLGQTPRQKLDETLNIMSCVTNLSQIFQKDKMPYLFTYLYMATHRFSQIIIYSKEITYIL